MQNTENDRCDQNGCSGPVPGNPLCESCRLYLTKKSAEKRNLPFPLTDGEAELLGKLFSGGAAPVSRFVMGSSREDDLESVALAPVVVRGPEDDVETVKKLGEIITSLEDRGLIALDYESPVPGFDDHMVRESAAFTAFEEAVEEGGKRPGFLFDTARLDSGSITLTDDGAQAMLDYYRG
ncbi:hypothetical protein [Caproicibacter sp.]|uniref:hypothetical protein n=1 Tax=Caproicibacter sp. TaxID=2814884 RepID=UPI0039899C4E